MVDADGDARPRRKGEGDDGPAGCMPGGFPRLAFVAMAQPPASGDAHADPPVELFQKAEGFRGTQMAEGVGVASLHDERAHEHGHIDADGFVIEETSGPTAWSCRKSVLRRWAAHEESEAVVGGEEAALIR